MDIYIKFDYFSTRTSDLWYNRLNLEQYGLTSMEVYDYIDQMEKDRRCWEEKRKKYEMWGFFIHLFVSIFAIPFILFIGKYYVCVLLDIYDEDSIINNLLSVIFFIFWGWLEYYIWKSETIINTYTNWLDKKYKKRSQYNPVVEKLLDDANFEHWKQINNIK